MTYRPPAAPMPDTIRHLLHARQHPARAVDCPHCGAHDRRPCTTISGRRRLSEPHPQRVTAWIRETACCPACQVEPGIPCHTDGWPLAGDDNHPQRETEAKETAA